MNRDWYFIIEKNFHTFFYINQKCVINILLITLYIIVYIFCILKNIKMKYYAWNKSLSSFSGANVHQLYNLLQLRNTNLVCLFNIVFPSSKVKIICFPPNQLFCFAYLIKFSTSSAVSLENKYTIWIISIFNYFLLYYISEHNNILWLNVIHI